jgi:hypothetical protein
MNHVALALFTGALLVSTARAQVVESVTLILDESGDGTHTMVNPFGLRTDAAGNLYVACDSSNAFRVTPAGQVTELIDFSGDGQGHVLLYCRGIALGGAGEVFVAGQGSDNAFRISPGGRIEEIIDATGDGAGHELNQPWTLAADAAGNAYVPGAGSHNAFKITPAGAITQIIDASGDGAGHVLDRTWGIAVDVGGNVYVTGTTSRNAFKITPTGTITQILDASGDGAGHTLDEAREIAVDRAGNVFVAGGEGDNAFKITPAGAVTQIIDGSGDGVHPLVDVRSIAVDAGGNAYVTGILSDNAFRIGADGAIAQIIDASGDGAGQAFQGPWGLTTDPAGDVFISSYLNSRVFKVDLEAPGSWVDKQQALAGSAGLPLLSAAGQPQAGQPVTLTLTHAQPLAAAVLVAGLSAIDAPFKGGVMVPHPDAVLALGTNAHGAAQLQGLWPAGLPSGTQTFVQWWIVDAAGPAGFAASNALKTTEP